MESITNILNSLSPFYMVMMITLCVGVSYFFMKYYKQGNNNEGSHVEKEEYMHHQEREQENEKDNAQMNGQNNEQHQGEMIEEYCDEHTCGIKH